MTVSYPLINAAYQQCFPTSLESTKDKEESAYLNKHLSPQDIRFINTQSGSREGPRSKSEDGKTDVYVSMLPGAPVFPGEYVAALTKGLYAAPADRKYASDSERIRPPAYYSGGQNHELTASLKKNEAALEQNEAAISSLNNMLALGALPREQAANLKNMVKDLLNVKTGLEEQKKDLEEQAQPYRGQMTKLLEDAKLLLAHRGVDGEAQVIEAVDVIDKVLRNIESFKEPGASSRSAKFYNLYTENNKAHCELLVATGRNPFPLMHAFSVPENQTGSLDQRWEKAMNPAREQARTMAQQLTQHLRPFANMSLSSQHETPQQPSQKAQDAGNVMLNRRAPINTVL